jgi:hypothetical protein
MDLNLYGAHFQPGAVAYWGTCPLATTYTSSSAMLASIPMDSLLCSGTVPVTVINPDGRASDDLIFTILYGGPRITSLTPASAYVGGSEFSLQLDGCDFQPGVRVVWNKWDLPDTLNILLQLSSVSSNRIIAQVPSRALSYPGYIELYVSNPGYGFWTSFYVYGGTLAPARPSSALTPNGKPRRPGNPPGAFRRDQRGTAPSGGRLAPPQARRDNSP